MTRIKDINNGHREESVSSEQPAEFCRPFRALGLWGGPGSGGCHPRLNTASPSDLN